MVGRLERVLVGVKNDQKNGPDKLWVTEITVVLRRQAEFVEKEDIMHRSEQRSAKLGVVSTIMITDYT